MYINEAWLAGFLEGDGCFSYQISNRKYRYPKIEIHQKNLEPLYAIRDAFGWSLVEGGRIPRVWVSNQRARDAFSMVAPYLSDKRIAQAIKNGFEYDSSKAAHNMSWFAGYYESEGCIHTKTNGQIRKDGTTKTYCALTISQYYDRQTSDYCVEACGRGRVGGPYMARGERRAYNFNLAGQEAIETVESIRHMLSQEKLAQLENVKNAIL